MYTTSEKVWWVKEHTAGLSYRGVCDSFHDTFPNRPKPNCSTVMRCLKRFEATGNVQYERKLAPPRHRQVPESDLVILAGVHANPTSSTTEMAQLTGFSQSTVWRKLNKYGYKCFEPNPISQELHPNDRESRLQFATKALELVDMYADFVRNIVFTDESSFSLHHAPDRQTARIWSQTNPRHIYPSHSQYPQKLNLWAGILNRTLLGPIVIDGTLTGQRYLTLLENEIGDRVVAAAGEDELWYMHDGCPAHDYGPARDFLRNAFPRKVIGTYEEPLAWPSRSPDLNPLEFFVWRHVSSTVNRYGPYSTINNLRAKINESCASITCAQLEAAQAEFIRRLGYCVLAEGGHFEHHL